MIEVSSHFFFFLQLLLLNFYSNITGNHKYIVSNIAINYYTKCVSCKADIKILRVITNIEFLVHNYYTHTHRTKLYSKLNIIASTIELGA